MKSKKRWIIILIFLSLVILTTVSSSLPDGLEWVAHKLHLAEEESTLYTAPFSDYTIHQDLSDHLNQILSAVLGIGIIVLLTFGFSRLRHRNRKEKSGHYET